jgi:hypothetical protein
MQGRKHMTGDLWTHDWAHILDTSFHRTLAPVEVCEGVREVCVRHPVSHWYGKC